MIVIKWFSSSDGSLSLINRECGLAHKTIIFVLDEFDLFALVKSHHPVPFSFSEGQQFAIAHSFGCSFSMFFNIDNG